MNDPFGEAIRDFFETARDVNLVVNSNYTEDEEIPVSYLFRNENKMPNIEKAALNMCNGQILDVGAAAGCHSLILQNRGQNVTALEHSPLACGILVKRGINNVVCSDIYSYSKEKYDTILLLMNGAGIGGNLEGLQKLLLHLKSILSENGQVLIDSSDIKYLFEEEDGSFWIDLASNQYYGEMEYLVKYNKSSLKFNWLFIDFDRIKAISEEMGLKCEAVAKGEHYDYLARITTLK